MAFGHGIPIGTIALYAQAPSPPANVDYVQRAPVFSNTAKIATYFASLLTTLGTATVLLLTPPAAPFHQTDWQNPLQLPYSSNRNPTHRRTYIAAPSSSPFYQTDWQNPQQPRKRNEFGFFDASEFWMLNSTTPIRNNWELQGRQRRSIGDQLGYIDATEYWLFAQPFAFYDWQNPQQRQKQVNLDQAAYNVNLLSVVFAPFAQGDWPNPQRSIQRNEFGFSDASEFWMLNSLIPFAQGDWANPQCPRQRSEYSGFTDSYKINLFAAPPSPFYLTDWQNPQRPRQRNEFGFSDASEFWMLNSLQPFAQGDWSNPQRPRQRSEYSGFTDQYKVLLFAAPPSPFYLLDWQNPRGPKSLVGDQLGYLDSTEFWMLNSLVPFSQGDWQNPQRPRQRSEYSGFSDPYKINLFAAPPSPFYVTDWPNPARPRGLIADQIGFSDPTEFWLLNSLQPFSQIDWANPLRGKPAIFGYDLKLNQLNVVVLPFGQFSWPVPAQPRRIAFDHIDQNKFNLYQIFSPFVQIDWPNPTRAKPAPVSYAGWFDVYKINLKSNPQRQTDWPNPSLGVRRTFANFGFAVRQQVIPGNFAIPGTGQLLLTTFEPMPTLASAHHWRTTVSLMGSVVPDSDLKGSIDNKEDLRGNIDLKRNLEGGGEE